MSLLPTIAGCVIGFGISYITWYLALRRTLGLQRLEENLTVSIVFVEEIFPFLVLGNFLLAQGFIGKACVAMFSALGGALAAKVLIHSEKKRSRKGAQL